MHGVRVLGAVDEPHPQQVALGAAQGRPGDAAVERPRREPHPGRHLDLLVLRRRPPTRARSARPAGTDVRAVVEVAQQLGGSNPLPRGRRPPRAERRAVLPAHRCMSGVPANGRPAGRAPPGRAASGSPREGERAATAPPAPVRNPRRTHDGTPDRGRRARRPAQASDRRAPPTAAPRTARAPPRQSPPRDGSPARPGNAERYGLVRDPLDRERVPGGAAQRGGPPLTCPLRGRRDRVTVRVVGWVAEQASMRSSSRPLTACSSSSASWHVLPWHVESLDQELLDQSVSADHGHACSIRARSTRSDRARRTLDRPRSTAAPSPTPGSRQAEAVRQR